MSEEIFNPKDFILTDLNFINSNGDIVDLKLTVNEINIFEDLFINNIFGNVVINDSTNMFSHYNATGNEFIQISFDVPTLNKPINKRFRVFKIGRFNNKPTNQVIILKFCSEELMISNSLSISKSYKDTLISDVIKNIATDQMKIKKCEIEDTTGINTLVIPYLNGFQSINWLASRAVGKTKNCGFVFYENRDGFFFKSVQTLLKNDSSRTYNYNVKNINSEQNPKVSDIQTDFFDVLDYEIVKTQDSLENTVSGKFSGTLYTYDPIRGSYNKKLFNGDDFFKDTFHLGTGKTYNNFEDRNSITTPTNYNSFIRFYPTNLAASLSNYIKERFTVIPTNVENWLMERNASLQQILNIRLKILVPGDTRLRIGDVLTFNLPSIEDQQGKNENEMVRKLDRYYSGKYLITAVRHKINLHKYETILEISKDALNSNIPDAQNNLPLVDLLS